MKYTAFGSLKDSQDNSHKWNPSAFPRKVDLRPEAENIEDQKSTSSCSANAVCSALEIMQKKKGEVKDFSRLFVYYNARNPQLQDERLVYDNGSRPDLCVQSLGEEGVCEEATWPFTEANVNVKPSDEAFSLAQTNKSSEYSFINSYITEDICAALASGYPVIFTIRLREKFFSLSGDLYTHPAQYDSSASGYRGQHGTHCMLIIGYDLDKQIFIVENSWTSSWGDGGFCGISFAEMKRSAYDCLVIREFNGIRYEVPYEFYDVKHKKTSSMVKAKKAAEAKANKKKKPSSQNFVEKPKEKSKSGNKTVSVILCLAILGALCFLI